MLRLVADENFDRSIIRGLGALRPTLEIVRAQDVGLRGATDPEILLWAAEQGRIVITHDVNTLIGFAYQRINSGMEMPGVIVVPDRLAVGVAIEEITLLTECTEAAEYDRQIVYLLI